MDHTGRAPDGRPRLHPLNRDFHWHEARDDGLERLSPDDVARFNADGFFVLRDAFTADEIAAVRAAIDPFEEAHVAYAMQRGGKVRLTDAQAITRSCVFASNATSPAVPVSRVIVTLGRTGHVGASAAAALSAGVRAS